MWTLLIGVAVARTPTLEPPAKLYEIQGNEICLRSGLRIRYYHEPSHPTVTWTTVIGSGGADDPARREGLAHMVEHLWFRNTRFGDELSAIEGRLGASMNGTTTSDDTQYPTVAPADALGALFKIESARLTEPLSGINQAVMNVERSVIQSERRWRYGSSKGTGYLALLEHVFPTGHRYHRPVIGTADSIAALTLEDAHAFVDAHYQPANTTWTISTPQPPAEFREVLQENLDPSLLDGTSNCALAGIQELPLNERASDRTRRVDARVAVPLSYAAWVVPSGYGRNQALLRTAVRMLDLTFDGTCSLQPMEQNSLAYCVKVADEALVEGRRKRDPSLETWLRDVDQVFDPVYGRQIYPLAVDAEASWLLDQLESLTSTHPDARHWHHDGSEVWLSEQMRQTQIPTIQSKSDELRKWFSPRRAIRLVVVPEARSGDEVVPFQDDRSARSRRAAVAAASVVDDVAEPIELSAVRQETLSNGMQVWVLPFGDNGFVRSRLVFRGGRELAPSTIVSDVREWLLLPYDRVFAGDVAVTSAPLLIGGGWTSGRSRTTNEIGIRGPSSRLEAQLYLLRERANLALLTSSKRLAVKRLTEQEEAAWTWPSTWASKIRVEHVRGPQGEWDPARRSAIRKVKMGEVKAWHRRLIAPGNAILLVVGDVESDEAIRLARNRFAPWRSDETPVRPHGNTRRDPPTRQVWVLDDRVRTDARVDLSCVVAPFGASDRAVGQMLTTSIRETALGTLRRTMGATYDVSAYTDGLGLTGNTLHLGAEVPTQQASVAVSVLLDVIDALGTGTVSAGELQLQQRTLLRRTALDARDARQVEARLVQAARSGHGLEWITDTSSRLANVGASDLEAALDPCMDHEVITVVGRADVLTPALEAAGLPVRRFDWVGALDAAP